MTGKIIDFLKQLPSRVLHHLNGNGYGLAPLPCETLANNQSRSEEMNSSQAASPPSVREQILRRFEGWLDRTLAQEEPPRGLAAEILSTLDAPEGIEPTKEGRDGADQYSLWSGLIALTQEIKLQGRTFKELNETISPLARMAGVMEAVLQAHKEAIQTARSIAEDARTIRVERDRELTRSAQDRARSEVVDLLLDLRDRLLRGRLGALNHLEEAGKPPQTGWFLKWFARPKASSELIEAAKSLEKGYMLTIDRLEEALGRFGVKEIACEGQMFDPHMMQAVDVAAVADVASGTVLEVYRRGYEKHGEVLRPAEVKVAVAQSIAPEGK